MRILFSFLFAVSCAFAYAGDYWGYHLILDCKSCDVDQITDHDVIADFVKTLVQEIGMKAYGDPVIEYFAEHEPAAAGYSLMQLIETSSITAHFADQSGDAYIDIFSCKQFDIETAKKVVYSFFKPVKIRTTFLNRQA